MQIGNVDAEYLDVESRKKLLREEEKERKMNEEVLCVPAGLSLENFERNVNERSVFLVRKYAEKNPAYRHIIPYCLVLDDKGKILTYKRKKGNEPRLEGQWSIGVGGHVHPEDGKGYAAIERARDRECIEELGITPLRTFGNIYIPLNDTEVDKVHLGFCQIITDYNGVLRPSKEIPHWKMLTIPELRRKNLETWAVYVLDLLESGGGILKKEKAPLSRGNIDKNINSHEDYNLNSGEALTPSDVIDIFQRYKGALQVFLGRRVHLVWRDNEIDWDVADKTLWQETDKKNKSEKRMLAELRMIRKTINPIEEQMKGIIHQYAAIPLIKFVEESLEKLTLRDREIIFYAYINHDWESPIGRQRYRTLSNRKIAAIVGCDHKTVAHVRKRAVAKICTGE